MCDLELATGYTRVCRGGGGGGGRTLRFGAIWLRNCCFSGALPWRRLNRDAGPAVRIPENSVIRLRSMDRDDES